MGQPRCNVWAGEKGIEADFGGHTGQEEAKKQNAGEQPVGPGEAVLADGDGLMGSPPQV